MALLLDVVTRGLKAHGSVMLWKISEDYPADEIDRALDELRGDPRLEVRYEGPGAYVREQLSVREVR